MLACQNALKLTYSNLEFPEPSVSGEGIRKWGTGEWIGGRGKGGDWRERKERGRGTRGIKGRVGREALPKQKLTTAPLTSSCTRV